MIRHKNSFSNLIEIAEKNITNLILTKLNEKLKGLIKMELEELKEELKKYLKEKRYLHCINVMKMSEKLAIKYNIDIEKTKKTALMHDLAKEFSKEDKLQYVIENKLKIDEVERSIIEILHGKISADICKKKYGFDDEMCSAIEFHTTGKADMTMLEKIIFIADKIEETRKYEGVEKIRELAFEDLDEAILQNINFTLMKNLENNNLISEKSLQTRNYILINNKK